MSDEPTLQPEGIVIRHIKPRTDPALSEPGEVRVLDTWLVPQPLEGINGPGGWQSGGYELRLYEEGTFQLTLPNRTGADGVLHIDRLLCLNKTSYQTGDEWFEVYEHAGAGAPTGQPLAVCTPTKPFTVTTSTIQLEGVDGLALARASRETSVGFWRHAPRDVFEHYCCARTAAIAEDFEAITSFADIAARFTRTTAGSAGGGRVDVAPGGGAIRLSYDSNVSNIYSARLTSVATVGVGYELGAEDWRFETEIDVLSLDTSATSVFGFLTTITNPANGEFATAVCGFDALTERGGALPSAWRVRSAGLEQYIKESRRSGIIALAIEQRGRWTHFFVDGTRVAVLPTTVGVTQRPAQVFTRVSGPNARVDVRSMLLRRNRPFLLRGSDKGDLRLPGRSAPGGLFGEYFDNIELSARPGYLDLCFAPDRVPYASRVDGTINFATTNPPAWQPSGPAGGNHFSVRWTGAIYLDLASSDRQMQFNFGAAGGDRGRLWLGRTMFGQQIFDYTNGSGVYSIASLRTHLGTSRSGWYPVVMEVTHLTTGQGVTLTDGAAGGSLSVIPSSRLSPQGTYNADVRHDNYFAQLEAQRDGFGYQYYCAPRRLESGEFPGQVIPRVREGRDTALILNHLEGVEVKRDVDAEGAIDTLLIDAQGVAVDGAQLTYEEVNYSGLRNGGHLAVHTDYISLSDISSKQLLQQRGSTEMTLRSSPAEEISARPVRGKRFVDSFPLTGNLAEFGWRPGDGLRVQLEKIRVKDLTPRQLLGASWAIRPAGRSTPSVSFRARPRSLKAQLRDALRTTLNADRNPQGSVSVITGALGSTQSVVATDGYSRVSLPRNIDDIVQAQLVVHTFGGTGSTNRTIEVNGANTGISVTASGTYDVTQFVARPGTFGQLYARLIGGDKSYDIGLLLLVRT